MSKKKVFRTQIMIGERVRVYRYPDRRDVWAEGYVYDYTSFRGVLHFVVMADVLIYPGHINRLRTELRIVRVANGYLTEHGTISDYVEPIDPVHSWEVWYDSRMRDSCEDGTILSAQARLLSRGEKVKYDVDGLIYVLGDRADYLSYHFSEEDNAPSENSEPEAD